MLKLAVGAPAATEIAEIIERTTGREEPAGTQVTGIDEVERLKLLVRDVLVPSEVKEHVAGLILATPPGVRRRDLKRQAVRALRGKSPRCAVPWCSHGKVAAAA